MPDTKAAVRRIPLDQIEAAPSNVKGHDLDLIVASIARFGFADPVVVDQRTGELAAGHGRIEALTRMAERGDEPPAGITVKDGTWQVPVYVGWASASDAEADAARIALNRTTEAGGWDTARLVTQLQELAQLDDGLVGLGYDQDEIDALARSLEGVTETDEVAEILRIGAVTLDDPDVEVSRGDVFMFDGRHLLFVVDLFTGHQAWVQHLSPDTLLLPYPEPYVTLLDAAAENDLLMIQPSTYLAGHLIDRHRRVRGEGSVEKW